LKSDFLYTEENLRLIKQYPHIIGLIAGRDKLTKLHSEWIKYIWTSGASVALMAHRGSYKSTAIVVIGAVWYLLFNPEARIAIVRKTHTDACEALNTIAKVMQQKEIRELFYFAHGEYPEFTKKRTESLDFSFKKSKTPEGALTAFGLNSQFTGHHFDFILCDDISTLKDRLSKAEREFTKMIWMELVTNVIDRGSSCCYVGTPWAPSGVETIIPKPRMYTIHDCGLITPAELEDIRSKTTAALFAANYELKFIADDDAPFHNPNWDDWLTKGTESVRAHVDSAYGGGDFNALTIMARRHDGKIQGIGFAFPGSIADRVGAIVDKCRLYKVRKVFVEKQSDRGWTASMLRQEGMTVQEYDENMKKEHKIATYLGECWSKIVWDKYTDDEYMSQIVDWTYESKVHDDAGDSASSLCRACFSKKGSNTERWKW
jgi:hypothetical protein